MGKSLKIANTKLLKNGFLPHQQTDSYEVWIDAMHAGRTISFSVGPQGISSSYKVHGHKEDRPELDQYYSSYTQNPHLVAICLLVW